MFNKDSFYELNANAMTNELTRIVREYRLFHIKKDAIEKLVESIQMGFRPSSLYALLLSTEKKGKEEEEEYFKSDEYQQYVRRFKIEMWKMALNSSPEDLKIYEDYIRQIYTNKEKLEYANFKKKFLERKNNDASNI